MRELEFYGVIIGYSLLAFLIIPFPLLTLSHLVFAGFLSSDRLAPSVEQFISFFVTILLSMILGCFFFWLKNRGKHDTKFFKIILQNVGLMMGFAVVVFQVMPLPFATTISHGAYRDDNGTYQWDLEHYTHWEFFGGAKMTSAAMRHMAMTPNSKTPEFENRYRYGGDFFILIAWLISLGLVVETILLIQKMKSK